MAEGFKARGNIDVSLSWKDNHGKVVLLSQREKEIKVKLPDGSCKTVRLEAGKEKEIAF
ncbi:MAG: hypothetical protein NC400_06945 [Clostridium sp.]|nr:hypothetical protein [Clostridium sp.]